MSSLDFVMSDAIFSSGIAIALPVLDGAVSFGFMGDSLGVNLLEDSIQPTAHGMPARSTSYSSIFTNGNYIDTNIKESENLTLMAVGKLYRPDSGSRRQWVGNYTANISEGGQTVGVQGSGIVIEPNGIRQWVSASYSGVAGSSSNPNVSAASGESGLPTTNGTGVWRCIVGITDGLGVLGTPGNRYIKDMTTGYSKATPITAGNVRDLRNPQTLLVGQLGPSAGAMNNPVEMMAYAIYNRALSLTELGVMYAYLQDVASHHGITNL